MNDKIKELSEKHTAAMIEAFKARFFKDNAIKEYREKEKIFSEIDRQLKQALKEEAEKC